MADYLSNPRKLRTSDTMVEEEEPGDEGISPHPSGDIEGHLILILSSLPFPIKYFTDC